MTTTNTTDAWQVTAELAEALGRISDAQNVAASASADAERTLRYLTGRLETARTLYGHLTGALASPTGTVQLNTFDAAALKKGPLASDRELSVAEAVACAVTFLRDERRRHARELAARHHQPPPRDLVVDPADIIHIDPTAWQDASDE